MYLLSPKVGCVMVVDGKLSSLEALILQLLFGEVY